MVRVHFADSIQRHVATPAVDVRGGVLREVLGEVFATREQLKGYVLDDQGSLRRHVAVFVDGQPILDPRGLTDPVQDGATIHVFQALSGG